MKYGKMSGICFALVFVFAAAAAAFGEGSVGYGVSYGIGVAFCFGALIFLALGIWEKRRLETKEERAEKKQRQREIAHGKKVAKEMQNKHKEELQRPVSAVLISTTTHRSALGTVTRAVFGGAILGPVGAIGGAASGTSKPTHATFSVKYASGRTATETVPVNSKRFNELSALLHG